MKQPFTTVLITPNGFFLSLSLWRKARNFYGNFVCFDLTFSCTLAFLYYKIECTQYKCLALLERLKEKIDAEWERISELRRQQDKEYQEALTKDRKT